MWIFDNKKVSFNSQFLLWQEKHQLPNTLDYYYHSIKWMNEWLTGGLVINGRRWQVTHHAFDVPRSGPAFFAQVIYLDCKSKYLCTYPYSIHSLFHFQMTERHILIFMKVFWRKWKWPMNSSYFCPCLFFIRKSVFMILQWWKMVFRVVKF